MENFDDIIFNEQWDKALILISEDTALISQINPYDIAWKVFYYTLVENGKERHISPFGKKSDLLKLVNICLSNGMKGNTIPQATAFKDKKLIKELLSNGHNIDENDFGERTALMVAAALNDIELVRFLINQNANVDQCDQDNLEAIDFTTSQEIIELLHTKGGKTEQEKAKEYDEYCEAREYWNVMREVNLEFMKGAEIGNINQVKNALQRSSLKFMTLNFAYPVNGWTALHFAVKNKDKDLINFLIKQGIDIDKKNIDGLTAKDLANQLGRNDLFDE